MGLVVRIPHISLFKITSETDLSAKSWIEHFNAEIEQSSPDDLRVRSTYIEVKKNNYICANVDPETTVKIDKLVSKVGFIYNKRLRRQETPGTHVSQTLSRNYHITLNLENKQETTQSIYAMVPVAREFLCPKKDVVKFVRQVQEINGRQFGERLKKSVDDIRVGLIISKADRFGNWIGLVLKKA
ncbi:hypothetical protein N9Y92_00760 [Chlamydiales bacterium]|nr:hypothetical protein [Chlamydiales bacterium]